MFVRRIIEPFAGHAEPLRSISHVSQSTRSGNGEEIPRCDSDRRERWLGTSKQPRLVEPLQWASSMEPGHLSPGGPRARRGQSARQTAPPDGVRAATRSGFRISFPGGPRAATGRDPTIRSPGGVRPASGQDPAFRPRGGRRMRPRFTVVYSAPLPCLPRHQHSDPGPTICRTSVGRKRGSGLRSMIPDQASGAEAGLHS